MKRMLSISAGIFLLITMFFIGDQQPTLMIVGVLMGITFIVLGIFFIKDTKKQIQKSGENSINIQADGNINIGNDKEGK